MHDLRGELQTERNERLQEAAALHARLRRDVSELHTGLQRRDVEAARIDARGLPILAVGVVLSGIPDELAMIPLGLG